MASLAGRNALTGIYCFLGCAADRDEYTGADRRNALTGIYCFLGVSALREVTAVFPQRRNALTGIYCFLGRRLRADGRICLLRVVMPSRAFIVFWGCGSRCGTPPRCSTWWS